MPELGIPFRRTVSESNKKYWSRVRSEPDQVVEWIIRGDGDGVDQIMRAYPQAFERFRLVQKIEVQGREASHFIGVVVREFDLTDCFSRSTLAPSLFTE